MATTAQGKQLTEQQRRQQLALQAATIAAVIELWPTLNPLDLVGTGPVWLRHMLDLLTEQRQKSIEIALNYYDAFRAAERTSSRIVRPARRQELQLPPGISVPRTVRTRTVEPLPLPRPTIPDPPPEQLATSLSVTGPVRTQHLLTKGLEPEKAARKALETVSKAAGRHVLNGGRDALDEAVLADEDAIGWARVTDGNPCAFCAMLASRGAVYKTRTTATRTSSRRGNRPSGQAYHDGCGCTAEPVFDREAPLPGRGDEFSQLWDETTAGLSGKAALNAFRRAHEKRQREAS